MRKLLIVIVSAILLSGCASYRFRKLEARMYFAEQDIKKLAIVVDNHAHQGQKAQDRLNELIVKFNKLVKALQEGFGGK